MLVRITASYRGQGVGQVIDLPPMLAIARIKGGTAVPVEESDIEVGAFAWPMDTPKENSMLQRAIETGARVGRKLRKLYELR
jgi:hypothetical protein